MTLNTEQQAAVDCTAKQIVCIASAGSGKTRVLVERIKRMVRDGIDPGSIVAITYTNNAAAVLKERLDGIVLGFTGTLHSFVLTLLRKYGEQFGMPPAPTVIDDEARMEILIQIEKEFGLKKNALPYKEALALITDDRWRFKPTLGANLNKEQLVAVEYHRRLKAQGLLDFDSILWKGKVLAINLKAETAAAEFEFGYRHLFVDEFQDAADADFAIYNALPVETRFFTGDDSQGIFSFRGGRVENLLILARSPAWTVCVLATNYRCESAIVDAAERLIAHNQDRYPKVSKAAKIGGAIEQSVYTSAMAEKICIAARCQLFHVEQHESVAILTRTNRLANEIRDHLLASGIPTAKREHKPMPEDWFKAKNLLMFLCAPENDYGATRWIAANEGQEKADRVRQEAALAGKSINQHYLKADAKPSPTCLILLSRESIDLISAAGDRLGRDWTWQDIILELSHDDAVQESTGGVVVSTCHSAKGLEFQHVIVAGCEAEAWDDGDDITLQESRRLMYTAMTRAEKSLAMTWCSERPQYRGVNVPPGPMEKRAPSRFLKEMV